MAAAKEQREFVFGARFLLSLGSRCGSLTLVASKLGLEKILFRYHMYLYL
jgi:hypothetical protein